MVITFQITRKAKLSLTQQISADEEDKIREEPLYKEVGGGLRGRGEIKSLNSFFDS